MTHDEYKAKQSALADAYGHRQAMTAKAWLTGNASQEKCEAWMLTEWHDFMLSAHDLRVEYEAQKDG